MRRHSIAVLTLLLVLAANLMAADKEVKGKIIRVDVSKMTLTVMTDEGRKVYDVNDATKFMGPRSGVSDQGIKDDRLAPGTEVTLLIAGNNRTLREVHMPERKRR